MKKIISVIIAVASLCACTKQQPCYVVRGQAGDLDGQAVLSYETPEGQSVSDTVGMKGGAFTFKGVVSDVVSAGLTLIPNGGEPMRCNLYVENCPIDIKINDENSSLTVETPLGVEHCRIERGGGQ